MNFTLLRGTAHTHTHTLCSGCSHLHDHSELDDWEALYTSIKHTSLTFLLEIKNQLTKNLHHFLASHFCQCAYCVLVVFLPSYKTSACAESPPSMFPWAKTESVFFPEGHILSFWPPDHSHITQQCSFHCWWTVIQSFSVFCRCSSWPSLWLMGIMTTL